MMSSTGHPVGIGRAEYCAWPSTSLATLFAVVRCRKAKAPSPSTSNWPMWETSKRPAAVRTALCSAMTPEYSTGMSHPPKSTILAPLSRWTALRGVLRSSAIGRAATLSQGRETGQRSSTALIPWELSSSLGAVAPAYPVTCWNCLGEYDAVGAVWCSDDPKAPTKLCPFCLHCFCDASAEYKQQFWRHAPASLVDELQTLSKSQDRLGDILIRMKKITTPQLLEALVEQRDTGRKLGEILVTHGMVTKGDIEGALRHQGVTRLNDTRAGEAEGQYWQQSSPDGVLDYLLALGTRKHASDVTIEPQADQVAVRYRIDGFSFRVDPIPKTFEPALERALFAMFGLEVTRRTRAQTGRTACRFGEEDYD